MGQQGEERRNVFIEACQAACASCFFALSFATALSLSIGTWVLKHMPTTQLYSYYSIFIALQIQTW